MKIIFIAALNNKRVIGSKGKIPWHISEDLKRFKRLTKGHTIVMGRKSFESLGQPLPDRRNVVITSHPIPHVESYTSPEAALEALKSEEVVFVIGGGTIFKQLLDRADELRLTLVDNDVEGDAYFPPYTHLIGKRFKLLNEEVHDGFRYQDYVAG